jgi:hypothetical protein
MRKILTLVAIVALAGCGGGGGGSNAPAPASPTTAPVTPAGKLVTPMFFIKIPAHGKSSGKARRPQYVASTVLSVSVALTADSVGISTGTLANNPAVTTVPAGTCNSGCSIAGPPSPPGTDSFTVVTYDAGAAAGSALNAGQLNNVAISAGSANSETITLGAIPATLSLSNVPMPGVGSFNAGTQSQSTAVSVIADDADGNVIPTSQSPAVFYVDATGAAINVTVSDPDTNAHGSCVVPSGTSTCTTGAATSATLAGPDGTASLAYDGLAENPVTITATASTATSGTAPFQPNLNAPAFNSSQAAPSGVALTSGAEIDLFNTSGTGSTGSESFTELGWTGSPYAHALSIIGTPACTSIATVSAGSNDTTNGTPFTATVVASPTAGLCTATVGDGLSSNTTDSTATLTVTYTTSGISANGKHRRN